LGSLCSGKQEAAGQLATGPDYNRLHLALNASRRVLAGPRRSTLELIREAAGSRYGNGSSPQQTKLNLLGMYQDVIAPLLIAKEPRYYAATADQSTRASVRIEQDWLNEQCVHLRLGETARDVVVNALYGTGILEVSLATPCDAAMQAWGITAGEPCVSSIDLDDWAYDIAAKDFRYASWMGYRYDCPVSVAKKMYGRQAADLVESPDEHFNREGDERLRRIFQGSYSAESFEPYVQLWKIYLPRERLIVTLADQFVRDATANGSARPLWEQKYIGPPNGPFYFLKFGTVPGQALARAPMAGLYELHNDENNLLRKGNATLRRLKEVTIYGRNQEHDALAIKKASDGEFVPVDNPDKIKAVVTAGAALDGIFRAAEIYKNLFSYAGGNLEVLGGRSPQTRTVGQEKILNANAGGGIAAMHGEVDKLMTEAGHALLWYAHHHPELVMQSEYKVPGTPGVNRVLYPRGHALRPQRDYAFNVAKYTLDPYSIRHKEPDERLAFIQSVMGLFTPLMPVLAQSGVALDANELIQIFAELGDSPALGRLFTAAPAPGEGMPGGSHERTLPGNTERTYTRQSSTSAPGGAGQAAAEMSPQDFGQGQAA
jgi:hypothetical protein